MIYHGISSRPTFLPTYLQKNIHGGLMVLKHMEQADVKPDSQTFSYLIGKCDCEEDIVRVIQNLHLVKSFIYVGVRQPIFLSKSLL